MSRNVCEVALDGAALFIGVVLAIYLLPVVVGYPLVAGRAWRPSWLYYKEWL